MRAVWLLAAVALGCARPVPQCPPVPACPSAAASTPPAPAAVASASAAATEPKPRPAPREKPRAQLFDAGTAEAGFFPRGDALELGLDGKALDQLLGEAEATKSDALIVLKDGKVIAERYFGQKRGPIETMSVTKSITALAVVMLVESGKLASLDQPISKFIPEFGTGKRSQVTVRHLLTQSSGLAHGKDAKALNAQKDRTAFSRRASVVDEPGSVFSYNNEATQLLSVVVEKAAGKPIDANRSLNRRVSLEFASAADSTAESEAVDGVVVLPEALPGVDGVPVPASAASASATVANALGTSTFRLEITGASRLDGALRVSFALQTTGGSNPNGDAWTRLFADAPRSDGMIDVDDSLLAEAQSLRSVRLLAGRLLVRPLLDDEGWVVGSRELRGPLPAGTVVRLVAWFPPPAPDATTVDLMVPTFGTVRGVPLS